MNINDKPTQQKSYFHTDFARYSSKRLHDKRITIALSSVVLFVIGLFIAWQPASEPRSETETITDTVIVKPTSITKDKVTKKSRSLPRKTIDLPIPIDIGGTVIREKHVPEVINKQRSVVIKSGDSLSSIFQRLDLNANDLQNLLQKSSNSRTLKSLYPNQTLTFDINAEQQLQSLIYKTGPTETIVFSRNENGNFDSHHEHKYFEKATRFTQGVIEDSLFLAGQKANLPDKLIMELAHIFGWDVDFVLDIRPGDSFSVLYEEKYLDGKKFDSGHIIAAQFINRGKTYRAFRYTSTNGETDYYTQDGKSIRKAFIRTPVNFTRISSRFSNGRKHPILHRIRAHKGVDYAAPRGTPVKASGDGKVIYIGRKGGYGKVIKIQHNQRYTTLYGHLNGFTRGLRLNSEVKQGQIIGYVGSTGLATGPHLHYEFHISGVQRDPLKVALPDAKPIKRSERQFFSKLRDDMVKQLTAHTHTEIAMQGK